MNCVYLLLCVPRDSGTHAYGLCSRICKYINIHDQHSLKAKHIARPTLSQFWSRKIRRSGNFIKFRNVDRRILNLQICERVGRVTMIAYWQMIGTIVKDDAGRFQTSAITQINIWRNGKEEEKYKVIKCFFVSFNESYFDTMDRAKRRHHTEGSSIPMNRVDDMSEHRSGVSEVGNPISYFRKLDLISSFSTKIW